MGSKHHPLDVFRSSNQGFGKASKRRRTVSGKVLASSMRPRPTPKPATARPAKRPGAGLLSRLTAPKRTKPKAPKSASAKSSKGKGPNRTLFYGAVGIVGTLALVVLVQQMTSDGTDLPTLRKEDALTQAPARTPPPPTAPAGDWFTIKASEYSGTAKGLELADVAREELIQRGFAHVAVIGYPDVDEPEEFGRYELIVGQASTAEGLQPLLVRLRAIADWPGGKPAPFTSALIVSHPDPASIES